jgi:hypothetical protein
MRRLVLMTASVTVLLGISQSAAFGQARSKYVAYDKPVAVKAPAATPIPEGAANSIPVAKTPKVDRQVKPASDLLLIDNSGQTEAEALSKSVGCMACHQETHDPHGKATVRLGCTDCHGGNAGTTVKDMAHVLPRYPEIWRTSANPVRSYTLLNHESPEFNRFVNPGDLRIAQLSCGTTNCHPNEVMNNKKSMMTHGAMLWGAALYNNGGFPLKRARFGESYSMNGTPQRIQTVPPPTQEEIEKKGVLPYLDPLPKFAITQPGNILRIFERGGKGKPEIGIPDMFEDPGRPKTRLSNRGLGTANRTDPVFIGLTKTRLFDPTLNFMGTNDHPGDYRSSGCTACHVVYANDRSPVHSGPYAKYGNKGLSFSGDPTIPKNESGHPIEHKFVTAPPSSQCIICHVHPGTTVMNSYLGFMWWDNETDSQVMYPKKQKDPTAEEIVLAAMRNPEEASARGNWGDQKFLDNLTDLNPYLKHTQFADFHGHGWVFKSVFKKDRKGNLLDADGEIVPQIDSSVLMASVAPPTPKERVEGKHDRHGVPVHLMDIHLEKGMHCVDCHFIVSAHGNGKLYGEVRAAVEIQCIDCHGTAKNRTNLRTSGPASPDNGMNLASLRTPSGKPRFEKRGNIVIQNSMVEPNMSWRVVQTTDTLDKTSIDYNQKSHMAKTVRNENGKMVWGDLPEDVNKCAHADDNMSCISCHSSWNPSCYGCHLPQKANMKMPELHNNGDVSRNYTAYNFQTLRDDVFMLARDGDVTRNRINPARSSCAIHVGSYNLNRESIYVQQQTISAEGFSGIAFSTNVPHTVRGGPKLDTKTGRPINPANYLPGRNETKQCTDCHLSKENDNNAIMAQLLMQGTNYTNFIGKYAWIGAGEEGVFAAVVTERTEPQTVIGSTLHKDAYPQNFKKHLEKGRMLEHAEEHPALDIATQLLHPHRKPHVTSLQARGEYLYCAAGEEGLKVLDIAFIDHKAFSERTTTAPVSPLGQKFYVKTKFATAVAAPATTAPDPTRAPSHRPENNERNRVAAIYAYIYVTDKYEGLITVGAGSLLDGSPLNNFLKREITFNPNGLLNGANSINFAGHYCYITCDAGLVTLNMEDPKKPVVVSVVGPEVLHHAKAFQVQFRYGFACDEHGVTVFDMTDLGHPRVVTKVPLEDAHNIYLARTYAYVAAGKNGLVILDIEKPEQPFIDQVFNAGGAINDAHDVKLGITYVSQFAYIADGKNGMRVVQLTSPDTPGNEGFSPRPTPQLVATYKLPKGGEALAIAEGIDRDRAIDETGNQLSVFGRVGAHPLTLENQQRMYLMNGAPYHVSDDPEDVMFTPARPLNLPKIR